ncbi:MAG: pseudaminic acid synthase [Deltaproteobacteria bacterium]|nr:pseudaminic acid synthase [Deltaproteobacteria bacterium]
MNNYLQIGSRKVGPGYPTYIIAELSGNHNQNYDEAVRLVHAAKDTGADAIKLQTYTADTLTIACENEYFRIGGGTLWDGRTLHDLYGEAYTPWEWQPKLKKLANDLGMDLFSTPFDATAVDFLEAMDVNVHKIASFEVVDIPLIERVAKTGKPMIMSTGMSTLSDIEDAVNAARRAGATQIALLKCTSAYPADPETMNLRTIPHLAQAFNCPTGLSDHTMGVSAPIAAVTLGACIIEKHFTISRAVPGPDSAFSLEPSEFKLMVESIRMVEKSLGSVHYGITEKETASRVFRRSLFVVKDTKEGELLTEHNVRSIRPGYGMAPKYYDTVIGMRAARDLVRGTPLQMTDCKPAK